MPINDIMFKIIENKYNELKIGEHNPEDIFWKIKHFEGNAIGQIGEAFVKKVFEVFDLPISKDEREIIHDEYDIISLGKKIEIKTARKGLKNNTFQFNGINPIYNHDFIFLIGITTQDIYFKIIDGHHVYDHRKKKHYLDLGNKNLHQLVSMNPGNSVNYKLTLKLSDLQPISEFVFEIKKQLHIN